MRNLFNKSTRIGDKLIKQTVNAPKLNYDFRRHFASSRLLTNCRHVRTFSLIPTNQRAPFHSSTTRSPLAPRRPLASHTSVSLFIKLSKHAYSSKPDEQSDLIDSNNFQSTSFSFTTLPSLPTVRLSKKELERLKPKKMAANGTATAKWHLKNIQHMLECMNDRKNRFDVTTEYTRLPGDFWECTITARYPGLKSRQFKAQSRRKNDAETNACNVALEYLKDQGVLNAEMRPILVEQQKMAQKLEMREKHSQSILEPLRVHKLNSAQRKLMEDFIQTFDLKLRGQLENEIDMYLSEEVNRPTLNLQDTKSIDAFFNQSPEEFNAGRHELYSMISGRPLKKMTTRNRERINNQLSSFLHRRDNSRANNDPQFDQYHSYAAKLKNLPIHAHREQLLDLIFENQVVVISGETGCGKSTQIPQYILEDMIRGSAGADCAILVTQPRRLPAISVAEQCALQFGESRIGNSFGYQVRFEKELPIRDCGVCLYLTLGMMMRKLVGNPFLAGVSHLIIDEVHERDVLTDLTLILLRRILSKNQKLKVILMSASLNSEAFSRYFGGCPQYHVSGRCFPVEIRYLPQIESDMRRTAKQTNKSSSDQRRVDYDLVVDLIRYINTTESSNTDSILCFLPGWQDIKKIGELIAAAKTSYQKNCPSLTVIPVHSKLSSEEQRRVFLPVDSKSRKVLLSTNICETSITIDGVGYVIDTGLCNEVNYNPERNVAVFGTQLISQANAKQRTGRAGRTRPGKCYRLFTEELMRDMPKYQLPEILRIPLEQAVIMSKLHCGSERVEEVLSAALDPPPAAAISAAVETLKLINVLDLSENLTITGKSVVDLSTHPRLSVCLVNSAMLGCFTQMLSLSALLSQAKDPFVVMPGGARSVVKEIKQAVVDRNVNDNFRSLSDYYALYSLLQIYENSMDEFGEVDIESRMILNEYRQSLNFGTLEQARNLKKLFKTDLDLAEMKFNGLQSNCLFDLALLSGLYPNVLKYSNAGQKFQLIDVNGQTANYSSESILSTERIENESYFVSIYFDSFFSEDRRKLMIKSAALIPTVYLLFAGKTLRIVKESPNDVTLTLDDCKYLILTMDKSDLRLVLKWKDIMEIWKNWWLCSAGEKNSSSSQIIYLRQFLDLTNKVFDRYAKR